MDKMKKLREIYNSFSAYEKYQLQIKRKLYEKQQGIRFLNLESYVNHLALEAIFYQSEAGNTSHHNYSA